MKIGRHRKSGERHHCGKLKKKPIDDVNTILPPREVILQRAAAVGIPIDFGQEYSDEDIRKIWKYWKVNNPDAGFVLGILKLRGIILEDQYEAGLKFGKIWKTFYIMNGGPYRYPVGPHVHFGNEFNYTPGDKDKMRRKVADMEAILRKNFTAWVFARSLLESVCVDDIYPLGLDKKWASGADKNIQLLSKSLDALSEFWEFKK